MENFDLNADGNIALSPLTGWASGVAAGMVCMLRLEYATEPKEWPPKTVQAVQLAILPAQAAELGQALLRAAEKALQTDETAVRQ